MRKGYQTLFEKFVAEGITDESFVDYCEFNDIQPTYEAYSEWLNEQEECVFDEMKQMIKPLDHLMCMITGTLGLWDGTHDIIPETSMDITRAINRCIGRDGELQSVVKKNYYFEVVVSHHDGTNTFKVYVLSAKGEDRACKNGTCSVNNKENIMKLPWLAWV